MEELSKCPSAYVRASPTRGVLGGIAEHTSDVITLCECAGYDVIIVESVGLGQSEVDIDYAVDMLLMVVPPGGGDGLQASKKGIMEAADLVAVNKADGSLALQAKHTQADYSGSMSFIRQKHPSWQAKVLLMSARSGLGLDEVEGALAAFHKIMSGGGALQSKRQRQGVHWMWGTYHRDLVSHAAGQSAVQALSKRLVKDMAVGRITPRAAANELMGVTLRGLGLGLGLAAEEGSEGKEKGI
jgi:LAO/AO transport system kinase